MITVQRLTKNKTCETIETINNWMDLKVNDIIRRIDENGNYYGFDERVTKVGNKIVYLKTVK